MPRRNYKELSLLEALNKLKSSGISPNSLPNSNGENIVNESDNLDIRLKKILKIIDNPNKKPTNMLCFVMYDIENNKVRNQIAKYLLKKGCIRVQRSIFLADITPENYNLIIKDLVTVQNYYENEDNIMIVPISTDYLKAMKVIGKSIDLDIILKSKSTIFF